MKQQTLVMKFGGTSVGSVNALEQAAQIIQDAQDGFARVIVITSAMSGVTDLLLKSASLAADGASYREILDVADWDRSIVTNVPGQSGQPESPFYGNLLPLWAADTYFPLVFSPARVKAETTHVLNLKHR